MPEPAHRELIARALRDPACSARYDARRHARPRLGRLVPERLADVATPPWFCHGLGWLF
jgi:hypothetical protein